MRLEQQATGPNPPPPASVDYTLAFNYLDHSIAELETLCAACPTPRRPPWVASEIEPQFATAREQLRRLLRRAVRGGPQGLRIATLILDALQALE